MTPWKTGREMLSALAITDVMIPGDPEIDGMSHHALIWAQVARDMLLSDEPHTDLSETCRLHAEESQKRWQQSKFFKVFQEEGYAGITKRGWEA
jgi:hypothetical protein